MPFLEINKNKMSAAVVASAPSGALQVINSVSSPRNGLLPSTKRNLDTQGGGNNSEHQSHSQLARKQVGVGMSGGAGETAAGG